MGKKNLKFSALKPLAPCLWKELDFVGNCGQSGASGLADEQGWTVLGT
jgi:hypothetical protein